MNDFGLKEKVYISDISKWNTVNYIDKYLKMQVHTYDFDKFGVLENSCAVASMMNLWIYYILINKLPYRDFDIMMKKLHSSIGSGPIAPITYNTKFKSLTSEIFQRNPMRITIKRDDIIKEIDNSNPVVFLIFSSRYELHYIQVLGYDDSSLLICDNWNKNALRKYEPRKLNTLLKWAYRL